MPDRNQAPKGPSPLIQLVREMSPLGVPRLDDLRTFEARELNTEPLEPDRERETEVHGANGLVVLTHARRLRFHQLEPAEARILARRLIEVADEQDGHALKRAIRAVL